MEEIWKDIKDYKGLYQISNTGKVKSFNKKSKKIKEIILKAQIMPNYYTVVLSNNGITQKRKIHKLMAEHFIDNPLNKKQVNHINGNKLDNRLENIEWCTASENQIHAIRMGLVPYHSRQPKNK